MQKPLIALTLGDAAGIGSELIAKLLDLPDISKDAHIVLVGDKWQWQQGQEIAKTNLALKEVSTIKDAKKYNEPVFFSVNTINKNDVSFSKISPKAGKSVIEILKLCMDEAKNGVIDAICFAPLNKQAMKEGGLQHEDELHFFAQYLGVKSYFCEFNTMGKLWTSRISSHIPLKDAYKYITTQRIQDATRLIFDQLLNAGVENPKIAVAAFNPHAGEGGTCGREEIEIIGPTIKACQKEGIPVVGPLPADTIFIKARDGEFDAIVTLYHDQGQIAIKLLGFNRGVTVQGGLPIPITTPAHGTAFDIAGQGKASVDPTLSAFKLAIKLGTSHKQKIKDLA